MTRRATIRTTHDDPELIANAIKPDNTDEMETTADDDTVVTRIERETTSGLHSTVDDYVVNVDVATDVARHAQHAEPTDTGTVSDNQDNTEQ
ncbi:KEOPS complex subunit Pcc1 [Natronococcus wangiae]|uniref:KEOPS complex subunit Pcc1 n=1 Tax=Natronococcus wangiae TaxID=3068275 RepID=UPI00273D6629|nr:KEOPS complex subunit Pcc1 [Natronococcus sp. AD5]